MTASQAFPSELLSKPIEDRLKYFETKVIAHPHLTKTHTDLLQAIRQPAGASLILVYGPTGVGKTTLRLGIQKQLLEEKLPEMEKDPGYLPVAGMEVVAPESGSFNWKDYYARALAALEEPLIQHKIDYTVHRLQSHGRSGLVVGRGVVVSELRRALEQCLRHRRLLAFIADEAQHFKKIAGGRRLLDQMDAIKSLAGMTGTVHVLMGTYEVLDLRRLNAQLSRRSLEIHFPRYHFDSFEERQAFQSVVLTLQRHLPLAAEPDLVSSSEYLYEGCVGCVGVLKHWLYRALAATLREDQPTMTRASLERQAAPEQDLVRMAREIKDGEDLLQSAGDQRGVLRDLLGLEARSSQTNPAEQKQTDTKPKRRNRRVGQRKPIRDKIGA